MIQTREIDGTTIAYAPVDAFGGATRRQRETLAVDAIVAHVMGAGYTVAHTAQGAPYLVRDGAESATCISVTHSRRLAVVAFDSRRRVGIDAEEWRDTLARVAPRFLSDMELRCFTGRGPLLRAWTIKEAVYKVAGDVAVDFRAAISIALDMGCAMVTAGDTVLIMGVTTFDVGDTCVTLAADMMSQ